MSDDGGQNVDWPEDRWVRILDRLEYRQAGLGLKFWGPPLWLEVTMTGPDSDRWPAEPDGDESWNWQSSQTCTEAESLFQEGAGDDELLVAVGRYSVENLSDADAETLMGLVQRDVHGALIAWEADRICRAFYIDHRRPWGLSAPGTGLDSGSAAADGEVDEVLTFAIAHC